MNERTMSITTSLVSQQILLHTNTKPKQNILCYQPLISHLTLSKHNISYTSPRKHTCLRAVATDVPADVAVNVAPTEATQEMMSSGGGGGGDDGVSSIISALLLIAFVALTILTVGVVYIAVTDFLQKREKEKFEKEEAEKLKKRSGKKKVGARAKAGPRGFGQKLEEFDD